MLAKSHFLEGLSSGSYSLCYTVHWTYLDLPEWSNFLCQPWYH